MSAENRYQIARDGFADAFADLASTFETFEEKDTEDNWGRLVFAVEDAVNVFQGLIMAKTRKIEAAKMPVPPVLSE